MSSSDIELDSPSIRALGHRFKLTEVFLRDDGCSSDSRQASSCPKHIRFKYDSDDDDIDGNEGGVSSKTCPETMEDSFVTEDDDLIQQMSALGLPACFKTSKRRFKYDSDDDDLDGDALDDDDLDYDAQGGPETMGSDARDETVSVSGSSNLCLGNACPRSYNDGLEQHQKESENTVIHGHDGDAKCNPQYDGTCYGTYGDWSAFWDTFYMRYYFYNAKTEESTWYPPPGMENFDISCISGERNADMPGTNPDPATLEYQQVETGPGEQRLDSMKSPQENMVSDEPCLVHTSDLQTVDGNLQDESSPVTSLDSVEHACSEDVDSEVDFLNSQDEPATMKRKKRRKNRTRRKSSRDNEGHEIEPDEEFYVDLTKYWLQRYLLFSRFDSGVKLDDEGWFSVTPEAIARHQASRSSHGIVIDCFAGVGGNAIQFAMAGKHVIAIDIDPVKIDYARHNATVYGVEDRIDFIVGDSLTVGPKVKADTVFLSPPWGGPDYAILDSYDIGMLQPYDGQLLFDTFREITSMIIMFLPRNVDVAQLAELALSADSAWSLEVEKNYLNGKLKAVTAYFSKSS